MATILILINILLTVYLAVRVYLLEKALLRFVSSQETKVVQKVHSKKKAAAYMRGYRFRKKGAQTELPSDFVISS